MSTATAERRDEVAIILAGLDALLAEEEDYDEEFLKPYERCITFARDLIRAASRAGAPMTLAAPTTIGDGGVFIQWGPQTRYVRLIAAPNLDQSYLYCKAKGVGRTVRPVTPEALVKALRWREE